MSSLVRHPRSMPGVRTAPGRLPHRVDQVHSSPSLVLAILDTTLSRSAPTPPPPQRIPRLPPLIPPIRPETTHSTEQACLAIYGTHRERGPWAAEDMLYSVGYASDCCEIIRPAGSLRSRVESGTQPGASNMLCARFFRHCTLIMTTVTTDAWERGSAWKRLAKCLSA